MRRLDLTKETFSEAREELYSSKSGSTSSGGSKPLKGMPSSSSSSSSRVTHPPKLPPRDSKTLNKNKSRSTPLKLPSPDYDDDDEEDDMNENNTIIKPKRMSKVLHKNG